MPELRRVADIRNLESSRACVCRRLTRAPCCVVDVVVCDCRVLRVAAVAASRLRLVSFFFFKHTEI